MYEIFVKLFLLAGGIGFIGRALFAMRSGYFTTRSAKVPILSRDENRDGFSAILLANFGMGVVILAMLTYIQFFYHPHS